MSTFLDQVVERTRADLDVRRREVPLEALQAAPDVGRQADVRSEQLLQAPFADVQFGGQRPHVLGARRALLLQCLFHRRQTGLPGFRGQETDHIQQRRHHRQAEFDFNAFHQVRPPQ